MSAQQNKSYLFKILVVGCCGAGKTCCIRKVVFNQFTTEYKTTIGVDFAAKTIKLNYKNYEISVSLQFWDIAGQEYYGQLSRAYYKGAYGCFVVCDLTSESLIYDIKIWLDEIGQKVFFAGTDGDVIPTVLLGNKIDIPKAKDVWETASVYYELKQFKVDEIFATSAVTGYGLDEAIIHLAKLIVEKAEYTQKVENDHFMLPVYGDDEYKDKSKPGRGCC